MYVNNKLTNELYTIVLRKKSALKKFLPQKAVKSISEYVLSKRRLNQKPLAYSCEAYPFGVNLIGFASSSIGLGQSLRLYAKMLKQADIPFCVIDVTELFGLKKTVRHGFQTSYKPKYSINMVHLNPDVLSRLDLYYSKKLWDFRINIGIWLWELETIPDKWVKEQFRFSEIITPSQFCKRSFEKSLNIPVVKIQYGFNPGKRNEYIHKDKPFTVLVMFDSNSTTARKNPFGAVLAYKQAFGGQKDVRLIIKVNNPQEKCIKAIKKAATGLGEVKIITENMTKQGVKKLIAGSDVLLSLHRSEGFGLCIAEAMLSGTAVVSTGWSGSHELTAGLETEVGYSMTDINDKTGIYPKGSSWAEPDTAKAAEILKRLYFDKDFYKAQTEKGMNKMISEFSIKKQSAKLLAELLYLADSEC